MLSQLTVEGIQFSLCYVHVQQNWLCSHKGNKKMKGNQPAGKNLTPSVLHSENISVSIRQTCHTFPLVFYSHICHMHAATILTYQES